MFRNLARWIDVFLDGRGFASVSWSFLLFPTFAFPDFAFSTLAFVTSSVFVVSELGETSDTHVYWLLSVTCVLFEYLLVQLLS